MSSKRVAAVALVLLLPAGVPVAETLRAPVLVELFTSEGCSSCPPADRLLAQLDLRAIVLEEHVDYWDHDGWKDPFSSRVNTQRQEGYGRQFNLQSVYTPEMVVDGAVEFSGADGGRAAEEIERAARRKKAAVNLTRSAAGLHIEVADAPAAATVYVAVADERGESAVGAGENKGRKLQHVAILRRIEKAGTVKRGGGVTLDRELPRGMADERIVVFVQEAGQGRVSGAAVLPAGPATAPSHTPEEPHR